MKYWWFSAWEPATWTVNYMTWLHMEQTVPESFVKSTSPLLTLLSPQHIYVEAGRHVLLAPKPGFCILYTGTGSWFQCLSALSRLSPPLLIREVWFLLHLASWWILAEGHLLSRLLPNFLLLPKPAAGHKAQLWSGTHCSAVRTSH